jgi:hypothetical protein
MKSLCRQTYIQQTVLLNQGETAMYRLVVMFIQSTWISSLKAALQGGHITCNVSSGCPFGFKVAEPIDVLAK